MFRGRIPNIVQYMPFSPFYSSLCCSVDTDSLKHPVQPQAPCICSEIQFLLPCTVSQYSTTRPTKGEKMSHGTWMKCIWKHTKWLQKVIFHVFICFFFYWISDQVEFSQIFSCDLCLEKLTLSALFLNPFYMLANHCKKWVAILKNFQFLTDFDKN